MSFDLALRATEVLLGFALLQTSLEHAAITKTHRNLFLCRAFLCIGLIIGVHSHLFIAGTLMISLIALARFNGPYNGGSDRMGLLITSMLTLALFLPKQEWRELAFGYLAMQTFLSYFSSGWVKVINPDWRNGRALQDVFLFSTYPVSENLRQLANRRTLLTFASWSVILFEVLFPIGFAHQKLLIIALSIAALFHLANAVLFGLNRFFWIWISSYPAILWLQQRLATAA